MQGFSRKNERSARRGRAADIFAGAKDAFSGCFTFINTWFNMFGR